MTTVDLKNIEWNSIEKFTFRFLFVYYFFIIFPFPFGKMPFNIGLVIFDWITKFWEITTPLFGKYILQLSSDANVTTYASSDTHFHYALLIFQPFLALVIATLWTAIDRKRKQYKKLYLYLITALRYYLAITMISYGFSKIFPSQFGIMQQTTYLTTYGDSSPMNMLWAFMSHSTNYQQFGGYLELIGGLLLLHRKTYILGAISSFGVMLNVFALNLAFNVWVKLYSGSLLLMSIVIITPELKKLVKLFVFNKSVSFSSIQPYFKEKKWNRVALAIKIVFIITILISKTQDHIKRSKNVTSATPLFGIQNVQQFSLNKNTTLSSAKDSIRWKHLLIDKRSGIIITMDDKKHRFAQKIDTLKKTITFESYRDSTNNYKFNYTKTGDLLKLSGIHRSDTLNIILKEKKKNEFKLEKERFNWVTDFFF